ncbi:MAG: type I-E CRISPR-associated endonuclease Cas1e [Planctomycetota bacterium]
MMKDLHELPKIRDALTYLYVEHARIDQKHKAIAVHKLEDGEHVEVPVPVASLPLLLLGPGTSITHAAMRTLARNNCLVVWCGEEGVRLYACGTGGTRSAANLVRQASLASDDKTRLAVVERMYRKRLGDLDPGLTLQQIRGMEGIRVREAYAQASRATGVPWHGRRYRRDRWGAADPANRALSAANSCLYGICHAAVLAIGYSPAIGFIHTGKQLSFVYDIADLYKADLTIPVAFQTAAEGEGKIERRVRTALRDRFRETHLLDHVVPDIHDCLDLEADGVKSVATQQPDFDGDGAAPGQLWDPAGNVQGGVDHSGTGGKNDDVPF